MNPFNRASLEASRRLVEAETKEIPLTRGLVAIVDSDNYEWLSRWKWQAVKWGNSFYAVRKLSRAEGRKDIMMHREILGMSSDDRRKPDHINRNGLDNRRNNLRIVSNFLNAYNCKMQRNNTSGYRGVSRYKGGRWLAYIKVNGKQIHCGYYGTPEEAAIAHDVASIKHYGADAMLNFQIKDDAL